MKHEDILKEVSKEFDLPLETVKTVYLLYWQSIKEHFKNLPIREDMSQEEFDSLKTSVNIPRIGKFFITYEGFLKKIKKRQRRYDKQSFNKDDEYNH